MSEERRGWLGRFGWRGEPKAAPEGPAPPAPAAAPPALEPTAAPAPPSPSASPPSAPPASALEPSGPAQDREEGGEGDASAEQGARPAGWFALNLEGSRPREERRSWLDRLKQGLSRSSNRLNEGITTIFNRRRLDEAQLEELEELLIASDMGTGIAAEVTDNLRRNRFNQEVTPEEVRAALAEPVTRMLDPVQRPLRIDAAKKPFVILVVGVNGSGKTTTIGKLGKRYREEGYKVVLAAGDTFRAAAIEQLQIWGERIGCPVVTRPQGADAAGLAYEAIERARAEGADILLIDTAGRLHNKTDLMAELQKIVRVMKKLDPTAPHSVLLVLDATTGQNAHAQAEIFRDIVGVTGLVMTKLDGTARGGVLVSLAEKFGIPIHLIGIGETADDLRPFEARAFARTLVGLEDG